MKYYLAIFTIFLIFSNAINCDDSVIKTSIPFIERTNKVTTNNNNKPEVKK